MFPFMAGIFISLWLQSPHRWKVSKRGGHSLYQEKPAVCIHTSHFKYLLQENTTQDAQGIQDSLGIILAGSWCCACLLAGAQKSWWLSIFSLPRAQIRCKGERWSRLTWLSLLAAGCRASSCQGHSRRGGNVSRRCWRPSGLCLSSSQSHSFWMLRAGLPEERIRLQRDTAYGIQVPSMHYRCAGLQCTALQQAYSKKYSWFMKSFRADKAESRAGRGMRLLWAYCHSWSWSLCRNGTRMLQPRLALALCLACWFPISCSHG